MYALILVYCSNNAFKPGQQIPLVSSTVLQHIRLMIGRQIVSPASLNATSSPSYYFLPSIYYTT